MCCSFEPELYHLHLPGRGSARQRAREGCPVQTLSSAGLFRIQAGNSLMSMKIWEDKLTGKTPKDRPVCSAFSTCTRTKFTSVLRERTRCFKTELKHKKLQRRRNSAHSQFSSKKILCYVLTGNDGTRSGRKNPPESV